MNIRLAVLTTAAAAVCCAATSCSAATPTASAPTPTAPVHTQAETAFLDRVHTAQAKLSDDDALESGRMTCADWDTLRDGHVPEPRYSSLTLENLAKSGTLTTSQVRAVEQASVETCVRPTSLPIRSRSRVSPVRRAGVVLSGSRPFHRADGGLPRLRSSAFTSRSATSAGAVTSSSVVAVVVRS